MTKEKKEDLDVLDEVMIQTILSKVSPQFEIVDANTYYLYSRSDSSYFVSLVEPEFWDTNRFKLTFIAPVVHSQQEGWKAIERRESKND